MSAVTTLNLRPAEARPPSNIEAEHAVIGAVLYDNEAVHACEDLSPHHFYEPAHARLWEVMLEIINRPGIAEPIAVASRLADDAALSSLGGMRYLADLIDHAPPPRVAGELSKVIIDASVRRDLATLGQNLTAWARDPEVAVQAAQQGAEDVLMGMTTPQARTRLVSAAQAASDVLAYLDAEEDATGVLTGLTGLDKHLGSLLPDDLILVAGRPGAGKSALCASIALNVAGAGLGVIEINSEMSTAQMMRRHLTDLAFSHHGKAAPVYKDIRRRQITPLQRRMLEQAAFEVGRLPLMMVKRTGLTLSTLRSLVRRQRAVWAAQGIKLGLITVDHVGLLQADGGGRDRYSDQTAIAIGMKQLAGELGIPVIALVQLSRKVEERDSKRPMLADLRDSGAWEENADTVIGVFREAYYANKEPEPKAGLASDKWNEWDRRRKSKAIDAILLKVREGEEGVVSLWASIGHNAIRDRDPDDEGGFL